MHVALSIILGLGLFSSSVFVLPTGEVDGGGRNPALLLFFFPLLLLLFLQVFRVR